MVSGRVVEGRASSGAVGEGDKLSIATVLMNRM